MLIHFLFSLLVAAAVRDLRNDAVPFMAGIVRHITMVAVVQQCSKYYLHTNTEHHSKLIKTQNVVGGDSELTPNKSFLQTVFLL